MNQSKIEKLALFEHQALENADNTRLLCLHPGSADEPIECSLYPTRLDFGEYRYTALSYVWGSADTLLAISCNGKQIDITRNLFSALKRLRLESKELMLWVDALCINQSMEPEALKERVQQVSIMHIIYGCAEQVIVDVGETDEDTPFLFSSFMLFHRHPPEFWSMPIDQWPDEILPLVEIPQLKGRFWAALARFLQRPWLERVWMFQEFVLAKQLGFLIGSDIVPEESLTKRMVSACELTLQLLDRGTTFNRGGMDLQGFVQEIQNGFQRIRFKIHVRARYKSENPHPMDLAELFHMTQWLKATSSQDNVYGLLALTSPEVRASFPVDYKESTLETALRLSFYFFENNPLYLLYRGAGINASQPSWSLMLPLGLVQMLAATWEPGGLNPWFHAGGEESLKANLNHSNLTIQAKGFVVGSIASKTIVWDPQPHSADEEHLPHLFDPFVSVSAWIGEHVSETFSPEIFWRTLVADVVVQNLRIHHSRDSAKFLPSLQAFTRFIFVRNRKGQTQDQREAENSLAKESSLFVGCLPMCVHRRLAVLDSGTPCLIPRHAIEGDFVCILPGAPLPLVLRPKDDGFAIVGCCFVWGMMQGEVFDKELPLEDLTLY